MKEGHQLAAKEDQPIVKLNSETEKGTVESRSLLPNEQFFQEHCKGESKERM